VDVVDVILKGSGIDEKFLGITLFALVPNTTEFMNAISFAMNGNIALRLVLQKLIRSISNVFCGQHGNWIGLRTSGLPFANSCNGCVLRLVRPCEYG